MSIKGFDYVTGLPVEMTSAQWRHVYSPPEFRRTTGDGETFYHSPLRKLSNGELVQPRIVAEAYAIVPAGKVVASG